MRDVPPPDPMTKLEIVADIPAGMGVASTAALRISRYLNSLGAVVKVMGQLEVASPSILTEYLPGLDGIQKLVVTEEAVKEFFSSRGGGAMGYHVSMGPTTLPCAILA